VQNNREKERKMKQLSRIVVALHRDESGQDLIEYALVAALIAFAAIAGMNYVASEINNAFSKIGNKLSNAIS
jgi:pilus assembly protein Flp/PilA